MAIYPLPQFEADLAEQDRELYAKMKPPTSVVVSFGVLKMVGEFTYHESLKPGCGTKFVVRTHRGTELGEMLTSTCPNSGCSKSVSRKEMLEYIENSGGKDYPYFGQGKVLRIATVEDLAKQSVLESQRVQMTKEARAMAEAMGLPAKIVDAEQLLGGERITFYFVSEERIDFRQLIEELSQLHNNRIDLRQVGSRDEARITADYEKCGQHCCCKQFLKVLKPVSMKNAKIQKATLDPLKISGRCGRLMCCLRYEESTYDDLKARLPKKKTRVDTAHGPGFVIDSQILTQLVLVQLEESPDQVAVALEELTILAPGQLPAKRPAAQAPPPQARGPQRSGPRPPRGPGGPPSGPAGSGGPGGQPVDAAPGAPEGQPPQQRDQRPPQQQGPRPPRDQRDQRPPRDQREQRPQQPREPRPAQDRGPQQPRPPAPPKSTSDELDEIMDALEGGNDGPRDSGGPESAGPDGQRKKRRRRRRRGGGPEGGGGGGGGEGGPPPEPGSGE